MFGNCTHCVSPPQASMPVVTGLQVSPSLSGTLQVPAAETHFSVPSQSDKLAQGSPAVAFAAHTPGHVLLADLQTLEKPFEAHSKLELQLPPTATVPPQTLVHVGNSIDTFE
jgi:hypothetical protein